MSDISGGALQFTDRDGLEAWLNTQPREVSIVIAARAALRVAPSGGHQAEHLEPQQLAEVTFATFWASALARVAAKYPTRAKELPAEAAADAADAADFAADFAADIWEAVSADANLLNGGTKSPSDLASEKLWLDRAPPDWATEHFDRLRRALDKENWQPWEDWYLRRINGYEDREDIELLFATLPIDPREKDPAEQNAALAAAIERLKKNEPVTSDAGIAQAVERILHDPHGAKVSVEGGQARIVGAASEGDLDAAQNPQTRQLH